MNILHLCDTPLSAAPYRLMQVQQLGGMHARLISHRDSYSELSPIYFEADLLLQKTPSNPLRKDVRPPSKKEVFALFDRAEVLHFHNRLTDQYVFKLYPELKGYLKSKKVVLQYHSPRAALKNVKRDLNNPDVDERLVVAQYQSRLYPECIVVPNVVPIWDSYHIPRDRSAAPAPMITYSPSNTNLKNWNNKGFLETVKAIKQVKTPHIYQEITSTPHRECLRLKQNADISIDEIITGSYHMCTLEALSMGQAAICNMDGLCEQALLGYTGTKVHPIIKATKDNLTEVLDRLLSHPKELKKIQTESRNFMELHWSKEKICKTFRRIYEPK